MFFSLWLQVTKGVCYYSANELEEEEKGRGSSYVPCAKSPRRLYVKETCYVFCLLSLFCANDRDTIERECEEGRGKAMRVRIDPSAHQPRLAIYVCVCVFRPTGSELSLPPEWTCALHSLLCFVAVFPTHPRRDNRWHYSGSEKGTMKQLRCQCWKAAETPPPGSPGGGKVLINATDAAKKGGGGWQA